MMMASENEPSHMSGGEHKCRTDHATESGAKHISDSACGGRAWEYEYPGTGVSFP
jgi:hypothetical protein